ncbi:right-handed parallel beta-helix repeat-containing protein, partial [Candidatus Woesearchaeota archaeon]|nr:right-handed parallel beta-helix repeat-containing protein [Candidatus Woesearchaeota archaeon]
MKKISNIANFFTLIPSANAQANTLPIITTINDTKIISIPANLKKGSKYILSYKFDAPDISPEFYVLGPLEIGAFKEARQWQIANDQAADINVSFPDAGAPGMNLVVQFVGTSFTSGDSVSVNSSGNITIGAIVVTDANGDRVDTAGRVLSTVFYIHPNATAQDVKVTVGGQQLPTPFKIVSLTGANKNDGNFSGFTSGTHMIGNGRNGTRTARGTIVLDSLIIPSGVTVVVNTTDLDPSLVGYQGYFPVTIIVDGPVNISGILNVSGVRGYSTAGTQENGASGGDGGPGGGGGGGGGGDQSGATVTNSGGNGFTGGGGGGCDDNCAEGAGGNGTGSFGGAEAPNAAGDGGGGGGNSTSPRVTGGGGAANDGTAGPGGGGGTGFFFGSSGAGGSGTTGGAGGSGGGGGAGRAESGGGGGFGTAGSAGTETGSGGSAHGSAQLVPLTGGSGGGGGGGEATGQGSGGGGGGGGAVLIVARENITIMSTGQILAVGGDGGGGVGLFGGGGSGGGIVLQAFNVSLGGTLNTNGGAAGGGAAGAGGMGRIRVDGLDNPVTAANIGIAGSNFTGPSIKTITDTSVTGTANDSASIIVYVQQKSGTNTTFTGTADANGLFDIAVTWYTGTNYIAVIQNSTVNTYTVMSSAAVATFDFTAPPDTTPPVINITNINASDTIRINNRLNITARITGSATTANITFNLTGNVDFYNFSFSLSGATQVISQNITVNVTRGNVINASVVACDASNNCAINSTLITVNNTAPSAPTILLPVLGANTSQQPLELNVTFAGTDADGDAITTIHYYINGKFNQTSLTNTTLNASDGSYILNVSISDGFANSSNATANFTLDTVAPVVGLIAPVNNSNSSAVVTFTFIVSSTLTPFDDCQLFGNWSSKGFVGNETIISPLAAPLQNDFTPIDFTNNATHVIWNARCNDTALNYGWNSSNFTLNIDYTAPKIALVAPANNTLSNGKDVVFTYIQTEAKPKVCQLWTNFSGTWKPNQTDTSKQTGIAKDFDNPINISTGYFKWNVGCNDTANNLGFNETNYTLRVDSNAPVVNATLNKSILQIDLNDAINLTVNVSDDNSLSFGQVIVNDTGFVRYFNFSLSGTSANFGQNITVSCSPCIINFTARVNDTINNLKTNDTIITVTPEKEITNCTNLDIPNTNYSLTQDANSGGTCFHVLANNVTLDCHGFEINYSQSVVGYGINISSYNYSTIRSCNIAQADLFTDTLNSYGVYVNRNSSNNVVFNNTITTSGTNAYGVYLFSTVYSNNIYSNNITTRSGNAYGVYLNSIAYNNSVYSNTIITIGSAGSTAYGVYLNSIAYNNSVYSNNITTRGSDGIGIRLETSAYSNLIYNNVINTSGGKTIFGSLGVYLTSTAYNNSVYSNTITTRGTNGVGVYLFSTAYNNSVYSNTITTNGSSGIGVYLTSTVYSNNIYSNNITTSNTFSYGIYLNNNVFNNTIYDNNITTKNTTSSYGIYLSNNVNNNTFFRNSISSLAIGILVNGSGQTAQETTRFNTFTNDTILPCSTGCADNYFDIVLTANVTDITFTNVSMNKSRIAFVASSPAEPVEKNNMTVRWFLDVNVRKSTDDTALQGAQVVINDSFSSNVFTGNTDANSAIPTQTVTEFTMNGSVTLNDTCINI